MDTPLVSLAPHTVVFDRRLQVVIMRLHGIVTLPIGSEIELVETASWARVIGVRLLASVGDAPATLCLDVETAAAVTHGPVEG